MNLFAYVNGRPTSAVDPFGLVTSADGCANCCSPAKMREELIKSKNFALVEQTKYVWSPLKVCNGKSCWDSARQLQNDLEQNVAPKCWITSVQLVKGGVWTAANFAAKLLRLNFYPSVHYVVKYKPCTSLGSNYFFDDYLWAKSGVLDPSNELSSPYMP